MSNLNHDAHVVLLEKHYKVARSMYLSALAKPETYAGQADLKYTFEKYKKFESRLKG